MEELETQGTTGEAAAGSGGAVPVDPVSAIAQAAGQLFDGVFNTINLSQQKRLMYQQRLLASMPSYKDLFAPYRTQTGYNNIIIIAILGIVLIGLAVAVSLKRK